MINNIILWLVFLTIILLGIVSIAILIYKKRKGIKQDPDYRTFFIMGIIWTVFGIIPDNQFFLIIGIAFMAIGLLNKNKWKKPKPWNKLSKEEKKLKKLTMIILGILVLLGLILFGVFFIVGKGFN